MMELFRELPSEAGRAIAIVTHATKNLASADRVCVMGRGGESDLRRPARGGDGVLRRRRLTTASTRRSDRPPRRVASAVRGARAVPETERAPAAACGPRADGGAPARCPSSES